MIRRRLAIPARTFSVIPRPPIAPLYTPPIALYELIRRKFVSMAALA